VLGNLVKPPGDRRRPGVAARLGSGTRRQERPQVGGAGDVG
jgi:hypothetical protein